jgi:hypothetical protein
MPLPRNFQFSATSLQDYVECPRRFQLRYLLRIAWPAPKTEPLDEQEHHTRLARDFHRLIHQHLLRIPVETLTASVHDPDLERWWQAYLTFVSALGNIQVMPEVGLSAPLGGYRVVAQYDALVVNAQLSAGQKQSDRATSSHGPFLLIIDWKTYRRRPTRAWLARRLQTRVYPAILVQSGASLINQPRLEPGNIEMCYWLAEYPHQPEIFVYDTATYQADLEYLTSLITEIDGCFEQGGHASEAGPGTLADEVWSLTSDLDHCRFCNYRSLCGRGGVAGPLAGYEDHEVANNVAGDESDLGIDLDWGQVQELAY